ncbi:hypothetical protein FBU30_001616 [Linnemannia zychae]|nr:hypothetical protein FBU30_001616 [Linnemannia zychae]
MFENYKEFCDQTPASEISFRAFLTALDDNREKEQLIGSWTGTVLPYLERHSNAQKRRQAGYLKKTTRKDLEAIVDEVFEVRDHVKALLPNVSQQEQAVSSLHTSDIKNYVAVVQNQQRQASGPSTSPSMSSPAQSTTPSIESEHSVVEAAVSDHTVIEAEEPVLDNAERETLLGIVEKASHRVCEWMVDGTCVACRFQEFQRACIESLVNNEIRKTEVADAMAIIGVFAPSLSTRRMEEAFSKKLLCALAKSTVELPEVDFDDGAMMKAVRLYIKGDKDNAADVLYSLPKKDRKIRLMLETLLEYLPSKPVDSVSENTFITKYIAPIIQAFVDSDITTSDFPNTESTTQKRQGLKADRPDIRAMAFEKEVCWGEVTGPAQETNTAKNQWDTYRLVRFGKAFLDEGHAMAPLIQVIYSNASYFRLSAKTRGLMLLEEVGMFIVPTTTATIPSLFATIPTLLVVKADIQRISDGDLHGLKRSWSYKDLKNAKTRLI